MLIANVNGPYVHLPPFVDQVRHTVDPTTAHTAHVVRIDFNADCCFVLVSNQIMRPDRTECFGEDNTGPTVQQAIRLVRPVIHWKPPLYLLSIHFEHLQSDGIGNGGHTTQVV